MKTVAFDWSGKGIDVTFDGVSSTRLADLNALLDELTEPHLIVGECTFESYEPDKRESFVIKAANQGHTFRVFSPRETAKYRRAHGIEKTDSNDALVIFALSSKTALLRAPALPVDPEYQQRRDAVASELIRARFMGTKADIAAKAIDIMGPYEDLSPEYQAALGNGKEYSVPVMSAVYAAATSTTSRREFEGFLGLYANAYPSIMRSEVTHWGYRMRNGGLAKFERESKLKWTDYRRILRQVRATIIAADISNSR